MSNFKKGNTLVVVLVAVLALTALAFSGYAVVKSGKIADIVNALSQFGAAPSISVTSSTLSASSLNTSGVNATSSTGTAQALTLKDISGYATILYTPTVGSVKLTLPASSTLSSYLPKSGNATDLCIVNSTTTSGINITLASSTGMSIKVASTSAIIGSGSIGCMHVVRKANTDFTVLLDHGY